MSIIRKMSDNIVQFVAVRGDLDWPLGALIGQGCHASVAAIYKYINEPKTVEYLKELDSMCKLVMRAESEQQLIETSKILNENNINHYLWREQPEDFYTALATAPYDRKILRPFMKNYQLFD